MKPRSELLKIYAYVGEEYSVEGLTVAREKDKDGKLGLWLHIDGDGNPAYARRFVSVSAFQQGVAAVEEVPGSWVYIFPDGANASDFSFDLAGGFVENRARVRWNGVEFHIRREDFTSAYLERFSWVSPYSNGEALVGRFNGTQMRIDPNGQEIPKPK